MLLNFAGVIATVVPDLCSRPASNDGLIPTESFFEFTTTDEQPAMEFLKKRHLNFPMPDVAARMAIPGPLLSENLSIDAGSSMTDSVLAFCVAAPFANDTVTHVSLLPPHAAMLPYVLRLRGWLCYPLGMVPVHLAAHPRVGLRLCADC